MAPSPSVGFEHNAIAMCRVINHLLAIDAAYDVVRKTQRNISLFAAGSRAGLPVNQSQAAARLKVQSKASRAGFAAYEREYKDNLKDSHFPDPAAY